MQVGSDYAAYLEDFLPTIDNVPGELQHVLNELLAKDTELHAKMDQTRKLDKELGKLMRAGNYVLQRP
jgi:Inhibitor of growth proteins N-terminal histone-binding